MFDASSGVLYQPRRPRATLLPQDCFDHPALHRRPDNITPAMGVAMLEMIVGKQCAGMRPGLRVSGARLRRGFITGAFGERDVRTLRWAIPGMWPQRFPALHCRCALTIYELARGLRATLGAEACGYTAELYPPGRGSGPDLRALPRPNVKAGAAAAPVAARVRSPVVAVRAFVQPDRSFSDQIVQLVRQRLPFAPTPATQARRQTVKTELA